PKQNKTTILCSKANLQHLHLLRNENQYSYQHRFHKHTKVYQDLRARVKNPHPFQKCNRNLSLMPNENQQHMPYPTHFFGVFVIKTIVLGIVAEEIAHA